MKENKLVDLSMDFSIKMLDFCDAVKGHYALTNQLERSSTSIGANIHEANYAHGKADFVSKLKIALKECYETEYWLRILNRTGYLSEAEYKTINNKCGRIRRMLVSSINTTKDNSEKSTT